MGATQIVGSKGFSRRAILRQQPQQRRNAEQRSMLRDQRVKVIPARPVASGARYGQGFAFGNVTKVIEPPLR
jgi:hypothetical protein